MKVKAIYVGRYHENTQTYTLCKENNKSMKDDMEKVNICSILRWVLKLRH